MKVGQGEKCQGCERVLSSDPGGSDARNHRCFACFRRHRSKGGCLQLQRNVAILGSSGCNLGNRPLLILAAVAEANLAKHITHMKTTSARSQGRSKTQSPRLGGVLGCTAPEADTEPRNRVKVACLGDDARKLWAEGAGTETGKINGSEMEPSVRF